MPPTPFSAALIASQFEATWSAPETVVEPKTWGWRRTIFSLMPAATSAMLKRPSCSAMAPCRKTWSSTSPSSSSSASSAGPDPSSRPMASMSS